MKAYEFRAMDNSGNKESGFMAAESKDEAAAQLKERGLFVMSLGVFDHEVTPAWSTISLTSPESIPSGDLLAQGLPSVLDQKGMTFPGSLNLRGVDGELHLVFGKPDARETFLIYPFGQSVRSDSKEFFGSDL